MTVHQGELLYFTATGDVTLATHPGRVVTPDGINGHAGVTVGRGGLIGRIESTGKAFDIGARTTPFKNANRHSHRYHPPPPIRMPADGRLFLGFKKFEPGKHEGAFEVIIRRPEPTPRALKRH